VKRDVSSFPNTHQWFQIRSRPIVTSAMKIGIVIALRYLPFVILLLLLLLFPRQANFDVLTIF
jgi:hypothetical protein